MNSAADDFVTCLKNTGYEASLDEGSTYRLVPDAAAASHDQLRVIDESGEDYLYPKSYFSPVPKQATPTLWKIRCMEDKYPGMWHRWYKSQCVALGWPPSAGYTLVGPSTDRSWSYARNRLNEMRHGDIVAVLLSRNRIGRIGQVVKKTVGDHQWSPFVPPGPGLTQGELGRRVLVRWDLTAGPDSQDHVVSLPSGFWAWTDRRAISRELSVTVDDLKREMVNPANWSSLLGWFRYERALADYIACYPNRLEDGLLPHPNTNIREHVFADHSRADVLLLDRDDVPVVVECKQQGPSVGDVEQLRGYMLSFKAEIGSMPRGVLVHGGASRVREDVVAAARREPSVEIVNYVLDVAFKPSA